MTSLFVENLTVIDFSYACQNRGIVGASWIVDIQLEGELDEQGMIFDFGHVKKSIKQFIDDNYDHKLWISSALPHYKRVKNGQETSYSWKNNDGEMFFHRSPASAVLQTALERTTPQNMGPLIAKALMQQLPINVTNISLVLRNEEIEQASYCYTHGLQQHQGNCQRIAHGHRSKIIIYKDDKRASDLEAQWAKQWQDIYLASFDHIINSTPDTTHLLYTAPQGEFELKLPTRSVYVIDVVSTVENIAHYLTNTIKSEHPNHKICVKAFEGVGKGAIAEAS